MSPELLLPLSALAAGYLGRKSHRFPATAADALNAFVIDVAVPAVILRLVPQLRPRWDLALLMVTPWLLLGVAALGAWLARTGLGLDRPTAAALLLCTALGNTSFLGFPLCAALLGPDALPLAAVYDQLGSFLILCFVAPWVIARAAGKQRPTLSATARRVLGFPPFLALILALLPWPHPRWLDEVVLAGLGAALVPVALFAVGLRLRLSAPPQGRVFVLGLALKLGLMPLCALLFATALDAPPLVTQVAVLESAMPAMVTAGAMLMAAGLAPELTAAWIGWGVLVSQLTVSGWAWIL